MLKESGIIFESNQQDKRKGKEDKEKGEEKKNDKKEKSEDKNEEEKIHEVIHKVHEVLFTCKTRFPFDIFPDTITLDIEKISIRAWYFFLMGEITSYELTEFKKVVVDDAFFFSTVSFFGDDENKPALFLKNLNHGDALKIQGITNGILEAKKEQVDLTKIPENKLSEYLLEIGTIYPQPTHA